MNVVEHFVVISVYCWCWKRLKLQILWSAMNINWICYWNVKFNVANTWSLKITLQKNYLKFLFSYCRLYCRNWRKLENYNLMYGNFMLLPSWNTCILKFQLIIFCIKAETLLYYISAEFFPTPISSCKSTIEPEYYFFSFISLPLHISFFPNLFFFQFRASSRFFSFPPAFVCVTVRSCQS